MTDLFNCSEWLVDRQVEAGHGARTALLCGDATLSYQDLLDSVRAAAGGLRRLGVRPEERVMMILRDGPELAVAILAAMRVGAVALPVNPLLPPRDLVAIARDARARLGDRFRRCVSADHGIDRGCTRPDGDGARWTRCKRQ